MPGSRLVERDIAAELSVSRVPVREAIRALVTEGLVTSRPRKCAVVREYTLDDVHKFAEVREVIETLLFTVAAERHDDAGLAELLTIVEVEERAAREGDIAAAQAAAGAFHEYMAVLADNDVFLELSRVFATRMKWIFGLHDDPIAMSGAHRELFDAIAARDAALVARLVAAHLSDGSRAAEARFASAALVAEHG